MAHKVLHNRQIFPMEGVKLMAELGQEELNTGPFPGKYLLMSKFSRMLQHARSHFHTQIFTWGIAGAAGWIHVWVVGWGSSGIARRVTCKEKKKISDALVNREREEDNKEPVWTQRPLAQLRGETQMCSQLARD